MSIKSKFLISVHLQENKSLVFVSQLPLLEVERGSLVILLVTKGRPGLLLASYNIAI